MPRLAAAATAVLALLFPCSNWIRLWPTASIASVSVCLLCIGLLVGLRGLRRSGTPRVVVLAALVYSLLIAVHKRAVGSLIDRARDIQQFARQSALLLACALAPAGSLSAPIQAIVLLAVAIVAALAVLRFRRRSDPRSRHWSSWAIIGALGIGATYFMFIGNQLHSLDPGIDKRTNVLAGLAYSLLVYAIVATAAALLFSSTRLASG